MEYYERVDIDLTVFRGLRSPEHHDGVQACQLTDDIGDWLQETC
jgi:hypothetical protein